MQQITRREAIAILGAGVVSAIPRVGHAQNAIIRTLLKDVAPDSVTGAILFHEHLSIRYPLTKALAEKARSA